MAFSGDFESAISIQIRLPDVSFSALLISNTGLIQSRNRNVFEQQSRERDFSSSPRVSVKSFVGDSALSGQTKESLRHDNIDASGAHHLIEPFCFSPARTPSFASIDVHWRLSWLPGIESTFSMRKPTQTSNARAQRNRREPARPISTISLGIRVPRTRKNISSGFAQYLAQ